MAGIPRSNFLRPIRFVFREAIVQSKEASQRTKPKLSLTDERRAKPFVISQLSGWKIEEQSQNIVVMSSQDKNSGNMVNLNRCLPSGGVIFC